LYLVIKNIKIMDNTGFAGNRGDKIKSDVFVSFNLKNRGGISLNINSKVKTLFGFLTLSHLKALNADAKCQARHRMNAIGT